MTMETATTNETFLCFCATNEPCESRRYGPSVAESSYWRRQIALYGRGPSDHGNELKYLSGV